MVTARKALAGLPVASQPLPRPKKKRKGDRLLLALEILLALGIGLVITSIHAALVEKGYQINQLKGANHEIRVENERLELSLAQLQSPERISQLARQKLGMQPPGAKDYVYVAGQAPTPKEQPPSKQVQVVNLAPPRAQASHKLAAALHKLSLVSEVIAVQN
ncbi:MAG: cell division protein FtsL [Clostridia bacterium]|nr:cell division protein FtsL [Clostridia bacterium]